MNIRDILNSSQFTQFFNLMRQEITVESNKKETLCINCKKDIFVEDYKNGVIICKNCGQVINEIIDVNPEWKSYDNDNSNARCSTSINNLLPQSALGTNIVGKYCNKQIIQIHNRN